MAKATFTSRWVAALQPPEAGQVDYFDSKPPSLGLRVTPYGRKTWFIMYRSNGRLRRLTLGTYPALSLADARQHALAARHAVAQGSDPAAHKQSVRTAPTVADLATQYIELYAKVHKKSWGDDARLLTKEVLPQWGTRKAYDIRRRDVIALLDHLVERGAPIQANRVLALVRKMFNWAISRELVEGNPCLQVQPPGKEHQRERVLSDEEIRAVWAACDHLDPLHAACVQLALLTAQRGGEVRSMQWKDVDLETGWWTIPASKAKNGRAHRVPLSPPAVAVLRGRQTTPTVTPWVFPSPIRPQQPLRKPQGAAKRLVQVSGVAFVPHDLRRTAASHMTSMGIPRLVVGKILNHVEPGVTKVYDRHSYDAEKRQALEAWGHKVTALVTGETGKVILLQRKTID
jgi:integrase